MSTKEKKALALKQDASVWQKIAPWVLLVGALLTTVAFVFTFTLAPLVYGAAVDGVALIGDQMVTNKLLISQKIFFFHMPVAVVSMIVLAFTAFYAFRFLSTKDPKYDTRSKTATTIALLFVLATMTSGDLWTAYEWQTWWVWDPRLTTYLVLTLVILGYFLLRVAIDDPERRAVYASVVGIIAFVNALVTTFITRIVPSNVHPVIIRSDSGLSPEMQLTLILAVVGFLMIAYGLYHFRLRHNVLKERVEALKEQLDD